MVDNATVVGVNTKRVVDTKEAAATAMVGDGAMVGGAMAEVLVGDGFTPVLLTMGHPNSLWRHTMHL